MRQRQKKYNRKQGTVRSTIIYPNSRLNRKIQQPPSPSARRNFRHKNKIQPHCPLSGTTDSVATADINDFPRFLSVSIFSELFRQKYLISDDVIVPTADFAIVEETELSLLVVILANL